MAEFKNHEMNSKLRENIEDLYCNSLLDTIKKSNPKLTIGIYGEWEQEKPL